MRAVWNEEFLDLWESTKQEASLGNDEVYGKVC